MSRATIIVLFLLLCTSSVAEARGGRGARQSGTASWYGRECKCTANGEHYDPSAMTAAHRTLPFDTLVRVTHCTNGCSAVVRINDRGPFKKGRLIDLSKAAAQQLRMIEAGLGPVEIAVIGSADE